MRLVFYCKLPKVLADRTHGRTRSGILVPAVIHHFAQPRSMSFGDTDTDHRSTVRRFLAGQNVHCDSMIVLPEREWEQTRQNLQTEGKRLYNLAPSIRSYHGM